MSEANSEEETLAKIARYSHKSLMAGYDLYGVRGTIYAEYAVAVLRVRNITFELSGRRRWDAPGPE